jgi:hypothetical protein
MELPARFRFIVVDLPWVVRPGWKEPLPECGVARRPLVSRLWTINSRGRLHQLTRSAGSWVQAAATLQRNGLVPIFRQGLWVLRSGLPSSRRWRSGCAGRSWFSAVIEVLRVEDEVVPCTVGIGQTTRPT